MTDREMMAQWVARDLPTYSYVNLGIGLPTLVSKYVQASSGVMVHSENGILGVGPAPRSDQEDPDLINAGKEYITLLPGGSFFNHADSFSMVRGGHIDICVLGAYQVSINGDLASWSLGTEDDVPAVGGAMDLVAGVEEVWVMTASMGARGEQKLVRKCTLPLTGSECVTRIYTELGIFTPTERGLEVREIRAGYESRDVASRLGLSAETVKERGGLAAVYLK